MLENKILIIDFDSTFIKVETLDELAKIILENDVHLFPIEELNIFSIKFSSFGPPARKNLQLNFE